MAYFFFFLNKTGNTYTDNNIKLRVITLIIKLISKNDYESRIHTHTYTQT